MPEENPEDGDSMFFLNELFFSNFLLRFAMAIFYQLLQRNYLVFYVWVFHMYRQSKNSFINPIPINFNDSFLKTNIYIKHFEGYETKVQSW